MKGYLKTSDENITREMPEMPYSLAEGPDRTSHRPGPRTECFRNHGAVPRVCAVKDLWDKKPEKVSSEFPNACKRNLLRDAGRSEATSVIQLGTRSVSWVYSLTLCLVFHVPCCCFIIFFFFYKKYYLVIPTTMGKKKKEIELYPAFAT